MSTLPISSLAMEPRWRFQDDLDETEVVVVETMKSLGCLFIVIAVSVTIVLCLFFRLGF